MRRLTILFTVSIGLLLAACSLAEDVTPPPALATQQAAQPRATAARPQPTSLPAGEEVQLVPATAPDLASGALIFAESCAPCHGSQGLGDGEMAGNLDVPVPALGDPDLALDVDPAIWFEIVTFGRMDRFMPPFQSLNDAQRWDVVAYALSLSVTDEQLNRGQELFQQACETCHGEDGRGGEYDVDITTFESFAGSSLAGWSAVIEQGAGDMPAFGQIYDGADRFALASYVRTLVYANEESRQSDPQVEERNEAAQTGTVRVSVSNGTEGAPIPDSLDITIVAFDGDVQSLDETVATDAQGQVVLEDAEIVPGRIYGALVEYQGVQYFSSGGHLLAEEPDLDLSITIFETTPETDLIGIDRLHVIYDFSVEGIVEVSELWLISNSSDRTIVQRGATNSMPVLLPEGFGELRFGDEVLAQMVTLTEDGFVYHEPILPGEPQELIFTFTLPYERSLDFAQPIEYPVEAVVLLTEENAPELTGSALNDQGTREMGEMVLHTYTIDTLEAGSTLALRFRGRHPAAISNLSTTNLLIGAGVLVLTLAVVLFAWQTWVRRDDRLIEGDNLNNAESGSAPPTRAALLEAIAGLDDAYEAGDLERLAYEEQRSALKQQLIKIMSEDDD